MVSSLRVPFNWTLNLEQVTARAMVVMPVVVVAVPVTPQLSPPSAAKVPVSEPLESVSWSLFGEPPLSQVMRHFPVSVDLTESLGDCAWSVDAVMVRVRRARVKTKCFMGGPFLIRTAEMRSLCEALIVERVRAMSLQIIFLAKGAGMWPGMRRGAPRLLGSVGVRQSVVLGESGC